MAYSRDIGAIQLQYLREVLERIFRIRRAYANFAEFFVYQPDGTHHQDGTLYILEYYKLWYKLTRVADKRDSDRSAIVLGMYMDPIKLTAEELYNALEFIAMKRMMSE